MRIILLGALWTGWAVLYGAGWRQGLLLTLATLALCYILMALAVYWSELLVFGRTHHEARAEAFTWPWPTKGDWE